MVFAEQNWKFIIALSTLHFCTIQDKYSRDELFKVMIKDRIEKIMFTKNMSKAELARRLHIRPQNVNVLLGSVNIKKLQQIANAIGCNMTEFLEEENISEINGYIEFGGEIFRIKNMNDFFEITKKVNLSFDTDNKKGGL